MGSAFQKLKVEGQAAYMLTRKLNKTCKSYRNIGKGITWELLGARKGLQRQRHLNWALGIGRYLLVKLVEQSSGR